MRVYRLEKIRGLSIRVYRCGFSELARMRWAKHAVSEVKEA